MRRDQFETLQTLSERLTDVVINEADPDNWPGTGIPLVEMTKEQRGDRYWMKKNAVATLSLILRIHQLVDVPNAAAIDRDDDLDAEVAAAEKEATRFLDELQRKSRKNEFDLRVHGKS